MYILQYTTYVYTLYKKIFILMLKNLLLTSRISKIMQNLFQLYINDSDVRGIPLKPGNMRL